jgi:transcriptional regulator with XRE-family HTH domain
MSGTRSKAAVDLKRRLTPTINQARLARELGVSQQAISAWCAGRAIPTPTRMARIEDLIGVPMRDWTIDAPTDADGSEPAASDAVDDVVTDAPDALDSPDSAV